MARDLGPSEDSTDVVHLIGANPVAEGRDPPPDALNYTPIAKAIAAAIRGAKEALTIGVFGDWGTGKTSLLRLIEREFSADKLVLSVWFNAWLYELDQNPLAPLVERIVREYWSRPSKDFRESLRRSGIRLGRLLGALLSAMSVSVSTSDFLPIKLLGKLDGGELADSMRQLVAEIGLERSTYVKAFGSLDKLELPPEHRVIVFIDDLDRCLPGNALRLLQSVKLAMSRPGFVFALALSPSVIERLLHYKYEKEFGIEDFSGKEYLEKIVDLPFYLPDLSGKMTDFSKGLKAKLPEGEQAAFEPILDLIESVCQNVPRAAIRFLNSVIVDRAVYQSLPIRSQRQVPLVAFAVARLLQIKWTSVYRALVGSPGLCDDIAEWTEDLLEGTGEHLGGKLAQVFEDAQVNPVLGRFLLSSPCRDWLVSPWQREATTQFQLSAEEIATSTISALSRQPDAAVAPEPPAKLRKALQGEKRVTLELAHYLWSNGWKEHTSEWRIWWSVFLRIVKATYYKFQSWAAREATWQETERVLASHCKKVSRDRMKRSTTLESLAADDESAEFPGEIVMEPEPSFRNSIGKGRFPTQSVASYLWQRGWKQLPRDGVDWLRFLRVVKASKGEMLGWAEGRITWREIELRLWEQLFS